MSDLTEAQVRDFARWLAPDRTDNVQLRNAVVQSFAGDKVNVLLSGSSFAVGIRKFSHVDCRVGDTVWILKNGPDYIIVGRVADADGSSGLPTGSYVPFAGAEATVPVGWLLCAGQTVSRTTYARLFAICGTTYNTGGEAGTDFRLPDLRGRSPFGLDNMGGSDAGRQAAANTLGGTGGAATHTLSIAELAVHSHTGLTGANGGHDHQTGWQGGGGGGGNQINIDAFASRAFDAANVMNAVGHHQHTIPNDGSGQPHNNMPPYIFSNWIIKT